MTVAPRPKSERVIINSAMSFAGAAQRSMRIRERAPEGWKRVLLTSLLCVPLMLLWWVAVIAWYIVTIVLLGLLTIPYRLLRRGARKRKAEALRHREMLEAVNRKPDGV